MAKNKEMTYSQALSELQKIVTEIESEEVEIDILAVRIRRASELINFCKKRLKTADEEVKNVLSSINLQEDNNKNLDNLDNLDNIEPF